MLAFTVTNGWYTPVYLRSYTKNIVLLQASLYLYAYIRLIRSLILFREYKKAPIRVISSTVHARTLYIAGLELVRSA